MLVGGVFKRRTINGNFSSNFALYVDFDLLLFFHLYQEIDIK